MKVAVSACGPTVSDRDVVLIVAVVTPLEVESVPVPRGVSPSWKVTNPVGLGVPAAAVTVAVRVTGWANTGEAVDVTIVVVVMAGATTHVSRPVLPWSFASPA